MILLKKLKTTCQMRYQEFAAHSKAVKVQIGASLMASKKYNPPLYFMSNFYFIQRILFLSLSSRNRSCDIVMRCSMVRWIDVYCIKVRKNFILANANNCENITLNIPTLMEINSQQAAWLTEQHRNQTV